MVLSCVRGRVETLELNFVASWDVCPVCVGDGVEVCY